MYYLYTLGRGLKITDENNHVTVYTSNCIHRLRRINRIRSRGRLSFFGFLAKFEEAWGMKAIDVKYNEDGTYTVKFKDKSIRTFKYIDGEWVEVPTPSEDEEAS